MTMCSTTMVTLLAIMLLPTANCIVVNRPNSTYPPAGMAVANTPQFIMVTQDDDCTSTQAKPLTLMMSNITNQGTNCTAPMTFFCTSDWSNCATQKRLWDMGHEIATHTKSHPDLTTVSTSTAKYQMVYARNYSINCGIPAADVVGFRFPYLECNPTTRALLKNNSFLYDSSLPVIWKSPESPSGTRQLWPYSLYQGIKQKYSCDWFGMSKCSLTEKYDKFYEVPIWQCQSGNQALSTPNIMDPSPAYSVLKAEFDRNYNATKRPVGVYGHWYTDKGYYSIRSVRNDIVKFLKYATAKPGVYVVTVRQMVDWMSEPHPISNMTAFLKRYKCPTKALF